MPLSAGKTAFRAKIDSGKTAWVDEQIVIENNFLTAYGAQPLSNTIDVGGETVTTNNLDRARARLEAMYDKLASWMENITFEAIKELFVNHAEVLPNTLNAGNLPVDISLPAKVETPGTIVGKGKVQ